jgi:hypothetical protein
MAKKESDQLNLTVVALVALVAIVGLVALVLNAASLATISTGVAQTTADETYEERSNVVGQAWGAGAGGAGECKAQGGWGEVVGNGCSVASNARECGNQNRALGGTGSNPVCAWDNTADGNSWYPY